MTVATTPWLAPAGPPQSARRVNSAAGVADQVFSRSPPALPGALPWATALAQARASGVFTTEHEAFWAAARRALGDTAGTRELVEVLLSHRRQADADVIAGIAAALSAGAIRADVVEVEVRRFVQARSGTLTTPESPAGAAVGRVVSLTERRLTDPAAVIAGLPPDNRPLP